MSKRNTQHSLVRGAENAGVKNAKAITRGNPSEEKTMRYH